MKSLRDLMEEKAFLVRSQEEIVNSADSNQRSFTPDEETKLADFDKKLEVVNKAIDGVNAVEARKAQIAGYRAPNARKVSANNPSNEIRSNEEQEQEYFPTPINKGGSVFEDSHEGRKQAYQLGCWYASKFGMPGTNLQSRCAQRVRDWGMEQRTNLVEGTNNVGGYIVPIIYDTGIVKVRNQYGVMRNQMRVKPMSNNTVDVAKQITNLSMQVTAEGSGLTQTNQTYKQIQLVSQKVAGYSVYSTELSEDAFVDIANEMSFEQGYGLAKFEDDAFWNGTGSSTYGNISGAAYLALQSGYTNTFVTAASATTIGAITQADIQAMLGQLAAYAWEDAKIYCSRSTYIQTFLNIAANKSGNTTLTMGSGLGPNYLGIPIVFTEKLPSGTGSQAGNIVMAFGDVNQAMFFAERRGIVLSTSKDIGFTSDLIYTKASERIAIKDRNIRDNDDSAAGSLVFLQCHA